MRKGNLSREQAIELAGESHVDAVERENCEPTSRCQTDGDTDQEWAACVVMPDGSSLTAYYYVPEDAVDGDGWEDRYDWQIHAFEAVVTGA